jgi:hypothetical protein
MSDLRTTPEPLAVEVRVDAATPPGNGIAALARWLRSLDRRTKQSERKSEPGQK